MYSLPDDRVHVAQPGVDAADLAPGTADAGALLCVAARDPGQGPRCAAGRARHDRRPVLALPVRGQPRPRPGVRGALAAPRPGRRPGRPRALRGAADRRRARPKLRAPPTCSCWRRARETYGMVVTEALARGLPVVAAEVGGVPEALGRDRDGVAPGLLVPPDDPAALGAALRAWLGDAALRQRLRRAARERRAALPGWSTTDVRRRGRAGGGGAMSVTAIRVSPDWLDLREAADAGARSRDLVEQLRRQLPASPPAGDPRPRVRHRGDGPVAGAAAAGAAALGAPRLGRRPAAVAAADLPGPARRRRAGRRRGAAVRHHRGSRPDDLAGASLITASALLDLMTGDELARPGRRLRRSGMSRAAGAVGRRAGRAGPADPLDARVAAAFDAHQRRMTADGRLLGPDAVGGRRGRVPPARGPRCASGPAPGGSARAEAALAAEWLAAGSPPRSSRTRSSPPRPQPTRADGWPRREPGGSPSPSATPTCWWCRDERQSWPVARTGRSLAPSPGSTVEQIGTA